MKIPCMRLPTVGIIFLALLLGCVYTPQTPPATASGPQACFVVPGKLDKCISLEVVTKQKDLMRGLMFRESLAEGTGMLFIFPRTSSSDIWMKNMRFAIDILWLDAQGAQGTLVAFKEAAPPCLSDVEGSPCPSYSAGRPARYVLEVPAGFIQTNGLALGQRISLPELLPDQ